MKKTPILFGATLVFLIASQIPGDSSSAAQSPSGQKDAAATKAGDGGVLDLPVGKRLLLPMPGAPLSLSGFPVTIAISPDGRYAVLMNGGHGSRESDFHQTLAVLDLASNTLSDFPDARLDLDAHQTYFAGLAFSSDGSRIYASIASLNDPNGQIYGNTGNGIAVYRFDAGKISPEKFIPLPTTRAMPGKIAAPLNPTLPEGTLISYPAGIAVVRSGKDDRLLVAANLSDQALLVDVNTGKILRHFDLSSGKVIPAAYPYGVVVARNARRAWVSLWNASQVAELDLISGSVRRWIPLRQPAVSFAAGSHPTALLLSPDEKHLYVALSNTDEVAVVETLDGLPVGYISTRLPGEQNAGACPVSLAQSADGSRLYVSDAGADAVAIVDTAKLPAAVAGEGDRTLSAPLGFIPTEWYPLALAVQGKDLLIASGKGRGTGPNSEASPAKRGNRSSNHPYILSLIHGSVARLDRQAAERNLPAFTQAVLESNRMKDAAQRISFTDAKNPIQHVIYIIKENRTYDQILGDLEIGNGDRSLAMYGEEITPNQHSLALEFGVLDNFYDSGEVSGDGHNWSTAATASDYVEKTIQIGYRENSEHSYDYEGAVAGRFPLEDDMPDVAEPGTGYLWTDAAQNGLSYRHYGEFVATRWCGPPAANASPSERVPVPGNVPCAKAAIEKGEPLPPGLGNPPGSASPWPWPVPVIAEDVATKQDLRGHFDPDFADFKMTYPDQLRADEFLREFQQFVEARKTGKGPLLPNYILLRLPNDHTAGTRPGSPTPAAAVADNDLAVGRVVEAVMQSPYWVDTAILIVEDDAQDGPDHVDAHRSTAFIVSRYAPGSAKEPFVDSRFYTTVSMLRTLEVLLGLPPMNMNDAHAPVIASLFSGGGNHAPFRADYRNRDNGLIYRRNSPDAPGAKESAQMDFDHADRADAAALNRVLWRDRMGRRPMPPVRHNVFPPGEQDADDNVSRH